MSEPAELRLRRLRYQSARRGMREMDLLLGRFAETGLAALGGAELATYEALLAEPDPDLFAWITGQTPAPERYRPLLARIRSVAGTD
ncbi:MAG TPA: succinate dehydrogenase assembly factor 2 [Paracoccaceae bacterium]|nr:succinate dehydrogenase assembly factor 2 [Paracoccaceae bacterium]